MGAKYESKEYRWRGKKVEIQATERCGQIDEFCLRFDHRALVMQAAAQKNHSVRKEADRL